MNFCIAEVVQEKHCLSKIFQKRNLSFYYAIGSHFVRICLVLLDLKLKCTEIIGGGESVL